MIVCVFTKDVRTKDFRGFRTPDFRWFLEEITLPHKAQWQARKAGPVGQSSKAGGGRMRWQAWQSSTATRLVAMEEGLAWQKLQLTTLVLTCFPHF